MSYDDWDIRSEEDELSFERAYDNAVKRRAKAQALEDRDTGMQLDPLPELGAEEEEEPAPFVHYVDKCGNHVIASTRIFWEEA